MKMILLLLFSMYVPDWEYSSIHDVNEGHRTNLGIGPQLLPTSE